MSERDMARSDWSRVYSKKQVFRDFSCGGREGRISLLKITAIRSPFIRRLDGQEVLLADTGYYWLQLALDGSHAWFTVMFDDRGELIQIYVDVTGGNEAKKENPTFEDMYLDYVVYGDNVYELDRDELEEAYSSGAIDKERYLTALDEGKKIRDLLTANTRQVREFFARQFRAMEPDLEGE